MTAGETSTNHSKPFYKTKNPIDAQAFLSSLTPEQLAESVEIECYEWPPQIIRDVLDNLGPKQVALLDCLVRGDKMLEEIQKDLKLDSIEEVEQVFADLRGQLRQLAIDPQEVYHADFRVQNETRGIERHFYANCEFIDGMWRAKDPKGWRLYQRRRKQSGR